MFDTIDKYRMNASYLSKSNYQKSGALTRSLIEEDMRIEQTEFDNFGEVRKYENQ